MGGVPVRDAIHESMSVSRHIFRLGLMLTGSGKALRFRNRQIVAALGLPVRSRTALSGISFSAIACSCSCARARELQGATYHRGNARAADGELRQLAGG